MAYIPPGSSVCGILQARYWSGLPFPSPEDRPNPGIESRSSWEIDGETVDTVSDFMFWGSKITVDGDFSHENKRHLEEKL